MADLLNLISHKRNTKILVNGATYGIDENGVCRDVKDADAEKLLQNQRAWRLFDPKEAEAEAKDKAIAEEERLAARAKLKADSKMKLIGADAPKTGDGEPTLTDIEAAAMMASQDQFEAEKAGEANPPPKAPDSETEDSEADDTKADDGEGEASDKEAEEEVVEWPDPKETMNKDTLHEIADAYEVPYEEKTTKKELVAAIKVAMYD